MPCPNCGREHPATTSCPTFNFQFTHVPGTIERLPWVCPLCGQANAPWVDRCDCKLTMTGSGEDKE